MKRRKVLALLVGATGATSTVPSVTKPVQEVVLELDARKLAELIAPELPDVIRRYGLS